MIRFYPVLRQYMRDHGVCWKELAVVAEMNTLTFHMKMWGIRRWNLPEAVRICCFFRTPDAEHLFVRKHSKSQFL
jgi:hypothetical protein